MIDAQAYVLRESGNLPNLEDVQVSDDLERGQVLVRVRFTSLCGTQLEQIFTSSRNRRYMPHLFGHEASAEVIAVGPGVMNVHPGSDVVVHWRESSLGLDSNPGKYWSQGVKINAGKVVTLSTHVVVPENRVTIVPNLVEMWAAPLLGCSLSTGWGSVVKTGGLQAREVTLVIGLGGVGRASAIAGGSHGNGFVYAVDPRLLDKSDLDNLGIKRRFDSLDQAFREIRAKTIPYPDLVVDTVGLAQHFELLVQELPNSSRIVLVGVPQKSAKPALDTQRLLDGLKIIGSNGGDVDPGVDLIEASQFLEKYVSGTGSGRTSVLEWQHLPEGIDAMTQGATTKVVYKVG
jgi:S-(hydroxymethyl)glutathione dehydrogenase / alcohol dehydrogenase